jgi:hypothetical protein
VRVEQPQAGAIPRDAGSVTLVAVDPDWMRLRLADAADWRRRSQAAGTDGGEGEWRDPTIARVPDEGAWPQLTAVVRHPVLLPSGEWIGTSGYRDGLLLDLEKSWPEPGSSREAAAAALKCISVTSEMAALERQALRDGPPGRGAEPACRQRCDPLVSVAP